MVAPEILEFYHKVAPRWFKVIRWRGFANRQIDKWKLSIPLGWIPLYLLVFHNGNPYAFHLCVKQPQTEEERLKLKRDTLNFHAFQRDWDIGQFNHERPPLIDVWKRRRNYPEYYEGMYEGYRQDGVSGLPASPVGQGIVVGTKK